VCVPVCCYEDTGSPAGVGPSATLGFFSTLHTSSLIHQVVVFTSRSTQNKTGHFGDVPQAVSWLGMEKTKPGTTKAYIHRSQEMYYNTKLETVSIAEPLQNQHMHRLPINLTCNAGPVVYAYRLNFIWIAVLCRPCGEYLLKCRNCNQIFTFWRALMPIPFYQPGPNLVANSRPTVCAYTPNFI